MFGIDDLLASGAVSLLRKYWVQILVAIAVASWTAAAYWAGGRGPRADLETERAEHRAQVAALEAQNASDKREADALITRKDGEHEANVGKINSDWSAFLANLCPGGFDRGVCRRPVSGKPKEPVRIAAEVCDDAAGNARLSDALQGYRREIGRVVQAERDERRRIAAEERRGVGASLAVCQIQTDSLVNLQETWAEETRINEPPPAAVELLPGMLH